MIVVAAGCGSGTESAGPGSTRQSSPPTTISPSTTGAPDAVDLSDASAALATLAGAYGEDAVYSAATPVAEGAVAAVTFGAIQQIEVVRFAEGIWEPITRFSMAAGNVDATNFGVVGPDDCGALCLDASTLTGSTDFLVPIPGADQIQLAVVEVEDDASAARLVPFDRAGDFQSSVPFATVTGDVISSQENDCIPSCAEGTLTTTPWVYDPTAQMFRPDLGD